MEAVLAIVVGGAAFGATYWLGKQAGVRYRKLKPWQVQAAYVPGVLAGAIICYVGVIERHTWIWVTGLCVMAGSLEGLRHGRARADDERKAALKAEQEAARRDTGDQAVS